ncbi:MAG TPA: DUF484 family protein [Burkholderiaceae bacterium]|nr:DUF484 family protein [Burkholderiaceae bacterium]
MDEIEIARHLESHPDFFERHPQLLDRLTLAHPQDGRAISLLERQLQVLRDRGRLLEGQVADLVRHGRDNERRVGRLADWACALLRLEDPAQLAPVALAELRRLFDVPHAALRLFRVVPAVAGAEYARPVSDQVLRLAASMSAPYCGTNVAFEPAQWLDADARQVRSVAMIPLREPQPVPREPTTAFGLLVLGSPDVERFTDAMGTEFLVRIGALASSALVRLAR